MQGEVDTIGHCLQAKDQDIMELKASIAAYLDRVAQAELQRQEAFEQREAAQRVASHLQVA